MHATVKTANILQQMLNPEAALPKAAVHGSEYLLVHDICTMHMYCDDAVVDHTHYLSEVRSWCEKNWQH